MLWARLSELGVTALEPCASQTKELGLEGVLGAVTLVLAVATGLDPHLTPLFARMSSRLLISPSWLPCPWVGDQRGECPAEQGGVLASL